MHGCNSSRSWSSGAYDRKRLSMEEDSDTRSSFPSPFKQDVANGSACTPETDIISFRKCLDIETNAPFLQNGKVQLLF